MLAFCYYVLEFEVSIPYELLASRFHKSKKMKNIGDAPRRYIPI